MWLETTLVPFKNGSNSVFTHKLIWNQTKNVQSRNNSEKFIFLLLKVTILK